MKYFLTNVHNLKNRAPPSESWSSLFLNPFLSLVMQLLLYLICHPSWDVRKPAYDATKKILYSSSSLAEDILLQFTNWLQLVGERVSLLNMRYCPVYREAALLRQFHF